MLIALLYLCLYLAVLWLVFYLVMWLLGQISVPAPVILAVKVIFVIIAIIVVVRFLLGLPATSVLI